MLLRREEEEEKNVRKEERIAGLKLRDVASIEATMGFALGAILTDCVFGVELDEDVTVEEVDELGPRPLPLPREECSPLLPPPNEARAEDCELFEDGGRVTANLFSLLKASSRSGKYEPWNSVLVLLKKEGTELRIRFNRGNSSGIFFFGVDYLHIVLNKDLEDDSSYSRQTRSSGTVLPYVGVACLGAILFGYHLGVVNGALDYLAKDLGISENAVLQGWVVSATLAGATLGSFTAGTLADKLGRTKTFMLDAMPLAIGAFLCSTAQSVNTMIVGRLLAGLGIGISSALVPLYISEISPTEIRGTLGSVNQLFICVGILVALIAGLPLAGNPIWYPAAQLFIRQLHLILLDTGTDQSNVFYVVNL
ncbi:putative metabolite transport protein [Nymphaea thermarum]|nr:putative metabolite transport protein [Nymphaea thermarum]